MKYLKNEAEVEREVFDILTDAAKPERWILAVGKAPDERALLGKKQFRSKSAAIKAGLARFVGVADGDLGWWVVPVLRSKNVS